MQAKVGVIGANNGTSYNRESGFAYQLQAGGNFTLLPTSAYASSAA